MFSKSTIDVCAFLTAEGHIDWLCTTKTTDGEEVHLPIKDANLQPIQL